jgi:hypothetical protein
MGEEPVELLLNSYLPQVEPKAEIHPTDRYRLKGGGEVKLRQKLCDSIAISINR